MDSRLRNLVPEFLRKPKEEMQRLATFPDGTPRDRLRLRKDVIASFGNDMGCLTELRRHGSDQTELVAELVARAKIFTKFFLKRILSQ